MERCKMRMGKHFEGRCSRNAIKDGEHCKQHREMLIRLQLRGKKLDALINKNYVKMVHPHDIIDGLKYTNLDEKQFDVAAKFMDMYMWLYHKYDGMEKQKVR